MKKILSVKSWLLRKTPQFRMANAGGIAISGRAFRIKDNFLFATDGEKSKIYFENRRGTILEFMADYVHVQIEVRKPGAPDYPGMEFDSDNYDVIEVPINDVEPRGFVSPGVFTLEKDNSQTITGDLPYTV